MHRSAATLLAASVASIAGTASAQCGCCDACQATGPGDARIERRVFVQPQQGRAEYQTQQREVRVLRGQPGAQGQAPARIERYELQHAPGTPAQVQRQVEVHRLPGVPGHAPGQIQLHRAPGGGGPAQPHIQHFELHRAPGGGEGFAGPRGWTPDASGRAPVVILRDGRAQGIPFPSQPGAGAPGITIQRAHPPAGGGAMMQGHMIHGPLHGQMHGPMHGQMHGQVHGQIHGQVHGPMHAEGHAAPPAGGPQGTWQWQQAEPSPRATIRSGRPLAPARRFRHGPL